MSDPSPPEATGDDATPVVYRVSPDCERDDLEVGARYHGVVDGLVEYGVFVELTTGLSGLVHESVLDREYDVGDEVVVELRAVKPNGDLSLAPAPIDRYRTETLHGDYDVTAIEHLEHVEGRRVHLVGEVVQIKQTGGPTIFHVRDETGVVPCAAFEQAGVRAYPAVDVTDLVHVFGRVDRRDGRLQLEVVRLNPLDEDRETEARARLTTRFEDDGPPREIEPLVEWSGLRSLWPALVDVATRLRRAAIEHRPIFIRHHADTDGMCAAVPLELALERFIRSTTHVDPEAPRHLIRRLPSKAPYYEFEDLTRDLNAALEGRGRHGQRLPLLVMLDNGSTTEDVPAYASLDDYDIEVIVIDHHHPDPADVGPYLTAHVNPYLEGFDYAVTTGMCCVELARMIDPSLTDALRHVPAVAGLADRSSAEAMADYLALAAAAGYEEGDLRAIGEALDYAAYWLGFDPGRGLLDDVLGLGGDPERHRALVDFLADRAARDVDRQLAAARPHVAHERLANGAHLYRADLEGHAYRFTYPPPGRTTGAIHDRMVDETGDPVVTIGVGPDFAVLRSDGVKLDIPRMVEALEAAVPGSGVSGGGHLVVGSLRFVPGMREPVLDALCEMIAAAEIDESLGSAGRRAGVHSRDA